MPHGTLPRTGSSQLSELRAGVVWCLLAAVPSVAAEVFDLGLAGGRVIDPESGQP